MTARKKAMAVMACLAMGSATGVAAQSAEIGRDLYRGGCAACHGSGGAGDGPVAELFRIETPDLTTLSSRNEGVFPMLSVLHVIDGRTGVRAHGGSMPVYGDIFMMHETADKGEYAAVLATRGRILSLAMYLESIQE